MKELDKRLSVVVKACDDKKALDIKVLDISKLTSIADYFVIVSGNSSSQTMAIADEVEDKMKEEGFEEVIKEGYQSARWILMDYGNIIVHIFHREEREFYNLERLWADSEELTLDNIL